MAYGVRPAPMRRSTVLKREDWFQLAGSVEQDGIPGRAIVVAATCREWQKTIVGKLNARWPLLAYALANAVLYSMLLPLWEGFDEPFHFGYIQNLTIKHEFPDPRTSQLSEEVGRSLLAAPASLSVKRNLPEVTSYPEFFAWPALRRQNAHDQLRRIDPKLRFLPSRFQDYEAQQAPLAYAILALPEWALAAMPLPNRVLVLRIIGGTLGALLVFFAAERLCMQLNIKEPHNSIAIFCALSSQMTWATFAHVANDWLAIPLTVWLLVMAIHYDQAPGLRRAAFASAVLSAGLLTKAYMIAFIPLIVLACIYHRRWRDVMVVLLIIGCLAGPWYVRNLQRYGTITGMQELRKGTNPWMAWQDIRVLQLPAAVESYARSALWTANNTFRAFSIHTLRALMTAWLAALVLWIKTRHRRVEWIVVLHCSLFIIALSYETAINYVYSHGEATSPASWHMQVLLVPILALALLGTSRSPRVGKMVAASMTMMFGYILIATYWAKLIPLYSGFEGRTSLASLVMLYAKRLPELTAGLSDVALAPAVTILWVSSAVTLLALGLQLLLIRQLWMDVEARPKSGEQVE
jgi:hypothetical protein